MGSEYWQDKLAVASDKVTFSILVATMGRPSLQNTLASIFSQVTPGDEVMVDINKDAPWGHRARNRMMRRAKGSHLLFIDDDDFYYEGALDRVRETVARDISRVHIFKMRLDTGQVIPHTPGVLQCGNVSTQTFCIPNRSLHLGKWSDRYEGDWDFLCSTLDRLPNNVPSWHDDVIVFYSTAASTEYHRLGAANRLEGIR